MYRTTTLYHNTHRDERFKYRVHIFSVAEQTVKLAALRADTDGHREKYPAALAALPCMFARRFVAALQIDMLLGPIKSSCDQPTRGVERVSKQSH